MGALWSNRAKTGQDPGTLPIHWSNEAKIVQDPSRTLPALWSNETKETSRDPICRERARAPAGSRGMPCFSYWRYSPELKAICETALMAIEKQDWKTLLVVVGDPLTAEDQEAVRFSFIQCCLSKSPLLENFIQLYKEDNSLCARIQEAVDWFNRSTLWTSGHMTTADEPCFESSPMMRDDAGLSRLCRIANRAITAGRWSDLDALLRGKLGSYNLRTFSFFQCCHKGRTDLLSRIIDTWNANADADSDADSDDDTDAWGNKTGAIADADDADTDADADADVIADILGDAFVWYLAGSEMWVKTEQEDQHLG